VVSTWKVSVSTVTSPLATNEVPVLVRVSVLGVEAPREVIASKVWRAATLTTPMLRTPPTDMSEVTYAFPVM
jgi:hypothetical protein